jgi:5-methyltetrahydropteroyltriglutamate--homocysteine methyltransferase
MTDKLLPTTVIGSYPQPDWLVDREVLKSSGVPRLRAQAIWRIPEPFLPHAQDDATLVAIHEMERAGIDIITDGEMRRESYSNRLATALAGIDSEHPAIITSRAGHYVSADRLIPAPDCGMKYLTREAAFGKLKALADGAALVRRELL